MRLLSIDVFRGITVALMILVNAASFEPTYHWFVHSDWHGCTLADLVFPFFIFIVGVSTVLSLSKLQNKGFGNRQLVLKILQRTVFLFLIGLLLNAYPRHLDFSDIRVLGVLQRIAICYFFASIVYLTSSIRMHVIILFSVLIAYWLAMTLWSVPGYEANDLTLEGNLAAYIDRLFIVSNHLHTKHFDPEGLFSTLPAVATCLLGSCLGIWLLSEKSHQKKISGMILVGFMLTALGGLWGIVFPINKSLWTSSYVLWTGGLGLLLFSSCYWLIDMKQWRKWSKPFELFGINALTVFILHVLFLKTQFVVFIQNHKGDFINLKTFFFENVFGDFSLKNASLFYALTNVLFWLVYVSIQQYRKKAFSKSLQNSEHEEYLNKTYA